MAGRYPVLFAVLVTVAVAVVYLVMGLVVGDDERAGTILGIDAVRLLIPVVLLSVLGWWQAVGFTRLGGRGWLWFAPLLVTAVLLLFGSEFPASTTGRVLLFAETAAVTGFVEEALFRGVILQALRPSGVARAVAVSAVLFGALHLVNLVRSGPVLYTGVQMLYAAVLGVAWATMRLATGLIWPLVAIHAGTDFIAFSGSGHIVGGASPDAAQYLGIAVLTVINALLAGYAAWLLRRSRRRGADGSRHRPIADEDPRSGPRPGNLNVSDQRR